MIEVIVTKVAGINDCDYSSYKSYGLERRLRGSAGGNEGDGVALELKNRLCYEARFSVLIYDIVLGNLNLVPYLYSYYQLIPTNSHIYQLSPKRFKIFSIKSFC